MLPLNSVFVSLLPLPPPKVSGQLQTKSLLPRFIQQTIEFRDAASFSFLFERINRGKVWERKIHPKISGECYNDRRIKLKLVNTVRQTEEAKDKSTFPQAHWFMSLVRGLNKAGEKDWEKFARTFQLTRPQQQILWHLRAQDGASISELATGSPCTESTIMVITKNLEKQGLVRLEKDWGDRRITRVYLTPKGRSEQYRELTKALDWFRITEELDKIPAEQLTLVMKILEQLCGAMAGEAYVAGTKQRINGIMGDLVDLTGGE
jgi:DNA-binding MarR family transcriptional regulator